MSRRTSIYLPRFTFGEDAFEAFYTEMRRYGSRLAIIYGERSWGAAGKYVLPALEAAGLTAVMQECYGKEATFENVDRLLDRIGNTNIDTILAVGGGKCIDTVKVVADRLGKPVFTIPSVASNCAPVTKISIMYREDGSFLEIVKLNTVPMHCFINPKIIIEAPVKYLWAGIGDAMAKHVESSWSAKAGERLSFGSELGITAGELCFYPMLRDAKEAMECARAGEITEALETTILNIVVAPGITSVSVHSDYNGGVAHALFYGLTQREVIEKNHLHGEVVSYGTLVNLMLDGDFERLSNAYALHRSIGLPICLADLELDPQDPLEDVLEATLANQELVHTPYPVTKEMLHRAILDLERYRDR